MANADSLTAPPAGSPLSLESSASSANSLEKTLRPSAEPEEERPLVAPGSPEARLPVELEVAVPVREFRVRNLLALEAGQLIETQWGHGLDVPLACGDVQLAWSEFEVVDLQLAVRLTRLV